ncbi:MAG: aminoacetone oxidase family FAD-binding enzyme [Bacteroidales bacterium]|nr:aminoacetone oxidase family FAD-binding enzyme [Bacteroidales bacterium]
MGNYSADIIVIGGGAAGLMAAAGAAGTFKDKGLDGKVIVLEKMARPGRKIMITGKGRCNFTNVKPWNEFSAHIHPKPNFLKPSFYNLNSEKMVDFLSAHGMESVLERGDRAFPASHLASDVVDALVRAAGTAGAEILCNKDVRSITCPPEKSEGSFTINCSDGSTYASRKPIICTGGLSYPKTGSTGDGYGWAESMGHTLRPLFPSLTAIVPKGYKDDRTKAGEKMMKGHIDRSTPLTEIGQSLCGNQLKNVGLSLTIDGNIAQDEFGDLDFTDGGLEGPIGFKISRKCVNALINGSKVSVAIDLKPAVDPEDLAVRISTLWNEVSKDRKTANKLYKDRFRILLTKVMPMSLIPAFSALNPSVDHKTLARTLKNWKMEIEGFVGYERCVVTAGGVNLDEITPKTLESKLIPGLYFAGEVLDLDADTGGYNLQTAFSTGYLAGISAARQ